MSTADAGRSLQKCLTHLRGAGKKRGGQHGSPIPTHFRPSRVFVQLKDRIPYWNIAPEDKVVLIRGKDELRGMEGTVDRVDRETNKVYLKENPFNFKKRSPNQYPGEALTPGFEPSTSFVPRAHHVSNFRLTIREGKDTHVCTRIKRTSPTWNRNFRRFDWLRMGLVPKLVDPSKNDTGWRVIKFKSSDQRPIGTVGPLDTKATIAQAITFIPSFASLSLDSADSPASVQHLSAPELAINPLDLGGGYHSRAQRTKRFNVAKEEAKVYGKGEKKEAIKNRHASRKAAKEEELEGTNASIDPSLTV